MRSFFPQRRWFYEIFDSFVAGDTKSGEKVLNRGVLNRNKEREKKKRSKVLDRKSYIL